MSLAAALYAAATRPDLVRSLVIGGGGAAVPLQVTGALKDIIEAPNLDWYRQTDSKEILGPVFDAIPGGPLPAEVRDDYLESYAGDRFVESTRYVRTYPTELAGHFCWEEVAERYGDVVLNFLRGG